jgi:transcriptional regulator with XRE-family HTH domain
MAERGDPIRSGEETHWPSVLRHFRFTHNIKQTVLAEDLGVTQAMVSRWESGTARPGPELQLRIQEMFDQHSTGTPMVGWRQFIADNPAVAAVFDAAGNLETASTGLIRESGLARHELENIALNTVFDGDLVSVFEALVAAGFFEGQVESAESADLLSVRHSAQTGTNIYLHGLHWPRIGEDGLIRWVASGARVSEAEFVRVRDELGGQIEIILTK